MSFVSSDSIMVQAWGGFKPCESISQCVSNTTTFSAIAACSAMTDAPDPLQTYCHCDLGLGGVSCSEMTGAASYKLIFQGIAAFISLLALGVGVWEIIARSNTKKKRNSIMVSLRFAVVGIMFVLLWNVMGASFILSAGAGADFTVSRWIYINMIVPGALVLSLR